MANELRFRGWVLAFCQPCKLLVANHTLQTSLLGQLALSLAMSLLVAAPIGFAAPRQTPAHGTSVPAKLTAAWRSSA